MSSEHVLPDWLRQIFPRSPADLHTQGATKWVPTNLGWLRPVTLRQKKHGHASTRRVRVVCAKCNSGWLSILEQRTKPLLERLIRGDLVILGSRQKSLIATWTAKTAMTAEFLARLSAFLVGPDVHAMTQKISS